MGNGRIQVESFIVYGWFKAVFQEIETNEYNFWELFMLGWGLEWKNVEFLPWKEGK